MTSITTTTSSVKVRSKFVLKDVSSTLSNSSIRTSYFEDVNPTWFNNLPVNVLIEIFKYFDEEELRRNIVPVCQHWKYSAQRPILWKKLVIRGSHAPLYFISKQLRMFTELETIVLDNIPEPTTIIRQICRCIPQIKNIAIRYCTSVPETVIRFIISSCPNLEGLDLCGTDVRGNFVYSYLSGINNLRKLNLSDCRELYIKSLLSIILNCPNLEDLRISKFSNRRDSFLNEDAILILNHLKENLKCISIDCTTLASTTIQRVSECRKLERIGLFGAANLTGIQFMNIWQALPNLKQMKIRNAHQIADYHVLHLFTVGKMVMENLVYLDFAGCYRISDESIRIIAKCCNKLRHLGLKSCKSIMDLKPLLKANPKLETLNIAFMTLLDTDTLMPLSRSLTKLLVDESRLLDKWLAAFQKENKNARVLVCQSEYNKNVLHINVFSL